MVAKVGTAPGETPDAYEPCYVTNLAGTLLVSGAEKDELQCLGTICGRDHYSKIVSKPFTSQVLAFYLAETRQVIGQMTILWPQNSKNELRFGRVASQSRIAARICYRRIASPSV
jgi:hypothetical protein